ncbi:hypothetical protein HanHA300_Chr07g0236611 [Helianthus annuus]|nr:hypothetical protein HanHA300_Chr07g0236611 [Helianthus annuus]KAJ0562635.1 hypothetical protein HanHA89_Chr07g0253791 [Helianthus annuus]KAJ0728010.1 hypothetical protein HanLR1_Chr07g0236551 [Helianthus annuus]
MGIRVLSGVHFREVLAYLLPLCNEDTGPVTPALIFRGVTFITLFFKKNYIYSSFKFMGGWFHHPS